MHRQEGEQGIQTGGQVQLFMDKEADKNHVEDDPQQPVFQAFLRHPHLCYQAEGCQAGVQPRSGSVGVGGHAVPQQQAAGGADGQAQEQVVNPQTADLPTAVLAAAARPLPPAVELQYGVDALQKHVGIEFYVVKNPAVNQHHDQANGPAPEVLADGQPDGQHTE